MPAGLFAATRLRILFVVDRFVLSVPAMHEKMHAEAEAKSKQQRDCTDKMRPMFGDKIETTHSEEDQQNYICPRGEEAAAILFMIHSFLLRCPQRRCGVW
tara:strand:+ start:704 stop:1003 length:300 start_codon:yes stop_codon:yes gene_type:complete